MNKNQSELAAIIGVDQSSYSRAERKELMPSSYMLKIRAYAKENNIEFNDSWFFEIPDQGGDEC